MTASLFCLVNTHRISHARSKNDPNRDPKRVQLSQSKIGSNNGSLWMAKLDLFSLQLG